MRLGNPACQLWRAIACLPDVDSDSQCVGPVERPGNDAYLAELHDQNVGSGRPTSADSCVFRVFCVFPTNSDTNSDACVFQFQP
jgi:hypothetical protein